jgi:Zinc carboxypeptidase
VTTAQSDAYVAAVDAASDRVVAGELGRSVQGRPLRYAIVGRPARVTAAGLAGVRAAAATLMDPDTSAAQAAAIAAANPAILWIASNVHGSEESGTDASLRVLWELADRSDCAAQRILDAAVVVILPIQNPDGREADTRRNAYGFDMNRDWFARTQPETDGKVELLRRYPPVVFVDAHEMGNTAGYFFPPNADPIYHEISSQAIGWINGLYGPAMQRTFDARKIPYFNYATYDLFYMGYGDTVPATGFGAAGMTFEKTDSDPTHKRVYEQYLTQWTTLSEAALHKQDVLTGWHQSWADARNEGLAGQLEPNEVVQPENTVQQPVPDITVRQYFIRADDPAKADEVQALVRRLQRMDVDVRRLTAPLAVPDFTPYGRAQRAATLPAGTYVVSLGQRQKHWVQAMLNEDTYTPFPYFYDVTAWSQPLLFDVAGGYSGAALTMQTAAVPQRPQPATPAPPADPPSIALYSMSPQFGRGMESSGWLRWLLDRWGLPHRDVTAAQIAAGGLAGADVLLVPDGYATRDPSFPGDPYGLKDLGPGGQRAIREWVQAGGRYVGWLDGAVLAAAVGVSSATFEDAEALGISSPGSLVRTAVAESSPLADGVGPFAYAFWDSRYVMRANGAPSPLRFPDAGSDDFFVSGYADGVAALGDSAAVLDERVGGGRTVAFGFEPNFRAFTDGTQQVLRNAILGDDPAVAGIASVRAHSAARVKARRAARRLRSAHAPARLVVTRRGERSARRVLRREGLRARVVRAHGRTTFLIGTRGRSGDELPWARELEVALRRGHVPVVMYRVP